jgi:ABC-type tungstate transport system substrate-binding protein
MELLIWNVLLSCVSALIVLWIKNVHESNRDTMKLLNLTREQVAREYMTKEDVNGLMNQVIARFDRLDAKLDDFIKEQRNAVRQ